jgi:DNA-binding FadR family transcriptional regulator
VLQPSLVATLHDAIDGDTILDQHRRILRAVQRNQSLAAQRAMRCHLEYLRELVGSLEAAGDGS